MNSAKSKSPVRQRIVRYLVVTLPTTQQFCWDLGHEITLNEGDTFNLITDPSNPTVVNDYEIRSVRVPAFGSIMDGDLEYHVQRDYPKGTAILPIRR